jgi:hypothetical protein
MPRLVFLLEEDSMKDCLLGLLPRLLPETTPADYVLIAHKGKQDLEKSIPIKLKGWLYPEDAFIIVRDQDSGDCACVKENLLRLCREAGREPLLVRIACRELESWFLGDLAAVESATGIKGLAGKQRNKLFKNPDRLGSPSRELARLVPEYSKRRGAKDLGPRLSLEKNTSHSFNVFISGVRRAARSLLAQQ